MAAERARQRDTIDACGAVMIHQQLDTGIKRGLGQLNGADICLRHHNARLCLLNHIREGAAIADHARGAACHIAIHNAVRSHKARNHQFGHSFDNA